MLNIIKLAVQTNWYAAWVKVSLQGNRLPKQSKEFTLVEAFYTGPVVRESF